MKNINIQIASYRITFHVRYFLSETMERIVYANVHDFNGHTLIWFEVLTEDGLKFADVIGDPKRPQEVDLERMISIYFEEQYESGMFALRDLKIERLR